MKPRARFLWRRNAREFKLVEGPVVSHALQFIFTVRRGTGVFKLWRAPSQERVGVDCVGHRDEDEEASATGWARTAHYCEGHVRFAPISDSPRNARLLRTEPYLGARVVSLMDETRELRPPDATYHDDGDDGGGASRDRIC